MAGCALLVALCLVCGSGGRSDVASVPAAAGGDEAAAGQPDTPAAPQGSQADLGGAVEEAAGGLGEVRLYESSAGLPETASEVLSRYRDSGRCVLVRAGYLDLLGSAWSCTVRFGDAVEVCVVSAAASGGSEVRVLRMEEATWDGDYGLDGQGGPA